MKQVSADHYKFKHYITKDRWCSMWHQLDEVLSYNPSSVLEVGGGPGVFSGVIAKMGIKVIKVDVDEDLTPDILAPINTIPMDDNSVDVCCAFQVLEHMEMDVSISGLRELARIARIGIVISVPNQEHVYNQGLDIPRFGKKAFSIKRIPSRQYPMPATGEHFWELHFDGLTPDRFKELALEAMPDFNLVKEFRVHEKPYHHFFSFRRLES